MLRHFILGLTALVVMALLPQPAWAQAPGLAWRIELAAPDDVRALLETHLDIFRYRGRPEVDAMVLERLIERVPPDARALLVTEGYFSPQIETEQAVSDSGHVVRIRVVPGEPARVASVALEVTGAIAANPEDAARIADLKKRWRLPVGKRFTQSAWGAAKDALLSALVLDGYPTARIAASEARVDLESGNVALSVQANSGPLFHFGAVEITGLERET